MSQSVAKPPKPLVLILSQGCNRGKLRSVVYGNSQATRMPGETTPPNEVACSGIGYFNRRTARLTLAAMDGALTDYLEKSMPTSVADMSGDEICSWHSRGWDYVFDEAFGLANKDLTRRQYLLVRGEEYEEFQRTIRYIQDAAARKAGHPVGLIVLHDDYAITEAPE